LGAACFFFSETFGAEECNFQVHMPLTFSTEM